MSYEEVIQHAMDGNFVDCKNVVSDELDGKIDDIKTKEFGLEVKDPEKKGE